MGFKINSGTYIGTKGSILFNKNYSSKKDILNSNPPNAESVIKKLLEKNIE